jgi:hypothetical protein
MPSVHPTSAGDWTTFLKRTAGVQHGKMVVFGDGVAPTNRDINPTAAPRLPYGKALLIPTSVGTSRIRRTASDYTNFLASRVAERTMYVQGSNSGRPEENGLNTGAITQFRIRVCNCVKMTLSEQSNTCSKCAGVQHVRLG